MDIKTDARNQRALTPSDGGSGCALRRRAAQLVTVMGQQEEGKLRDSAMVRSSRPNGRLGRTIRSQGCAAPGPDATRG